MLAQRARSSSNAVAREFGRFEQYFFCAVLDFGIQPAHYSRKRGGLASVADYKVFVV